MLCCCRPTTTTASTVNRYSSSFFSRHCPRRYNQHLIALHQRQSVRTTSRTFFHSKLPRHTTTSRFLCWRTRSLSSIMPISFDVLKKQNAETSNALIEQLGNNADFLTLSKYEGDLTTQRDKEDDAKLQVGIDYAISKGVLDKDYVPEPYQKIDVLGKTPTDVAKEILETVQHEKEDTHNSNKGSVIVLVGLSGTGKGTTVERLRSILVKEKHQVVVTWSNGNVFRSVTLLAATWCEQNVEGGTFDSTKALTKENLASFMDMLSFGKFNGKYDIRIDGLGLDLLVSDVQNTILKSPKVSKNIPTVAEVTQGEVILFAANATDIMRQDGLVVLLEGREQTVNYVKTPYRFSLVLSDESLIGKRRAAQRLMAATLKDLQSTENNDVTDEQVSEALNKELTKMVAEIHHHD